jgi:hypothetical protein
LEEKLKFDGGNKYKSVRGRVDEVGRRGQI